MGDGDHQDERQGRPDFDALAALILSDDPALEELLEKLGAAIERGATAAEQAEAWREHLLAAPERATREEIDAALVATERERRAAHSAAALWEELAKSGGVSS